ncbi:GNAT family N-acetyltransferase [Breoghania sp. JC706]|uniref:GNAT family N-acetyltransferase n=1 Tax=Breoghania sp. JC706 TaxID=3117732 RepID=UPI00300AACD8
MAMMNDGASLPDLTATDVRLVPFAPDHLDGAVRLSEQAGWPHRSDDWALTLSASRGVAALSGDMVVGTALCSTFGDVAALNMIIVDASMRGRGLGRQLMNAVIEMAGPREIRLTATQDGLPLYRKLGFVETGQIVQHQGIAQADGADRAVTTGSLGDVARLAEMDRAASGMAREPVLRRIAETGTVLRAEKGFAMLRPFGRGQVVGPVVAEDGDTARALIAQAARRAQGTFLRIDVPASHDLSPFLESLGLARAGGGTSMVCQARPEASTPFTTFALASQALG